jgi:hypothetical protein
MIRGLLHICPMPSMRASKEPCYDRERTGSGDQRKYRDVDAVARILGADMDIRVRILRMNASRVTAMSDGRRLLAWLRRNPCDTFVKHVRNNVAENRPFRRDARRSRHVSETWGRLTQHVKADRAFPCAPHGRSRESLARALETRCCSFFPFSTRSSPRVARTSRHAHVRLHARRCGSVRAHP